MTCIYCDFYGKCEMWDDDGMIFEHVSESCDDYGYCLVEEDPDPSMSCEDYVEA